MMHPSVSLYIMKLSQAVRIFYFIPESQISLEKHNTPGNLFYKYNVLIYYLWLFILYQDDCIYKHLGEAWRMTLELDLECHMSWWSH